MFSHINVGVSQISRAVAFYGPVLEPLGLVQSYSEPDEGVAAWSSSGSEVPSFIVCLPLNGAPASVGNGQMTAFLAPSRAAVRQAHAAAIRGGGRDEGAPGPRPDYHANFFGAYFRDPDGNKICVCCHHDEP